jgi:hypothetical protein
MGREVDEGEGTEGDEGRGEHVRGGLVLPCAEDRLRVRWRAEAEVVVEPTSSEGMANHCGRSMRTELLSSLSSLSSLLSLYVRPHSLIMTTSQKGLDLIADAAEANKELQSALTQHVDTLTQQLKQIDLIMRALYIPAIVVQRRMKDAESNADVPEQVRPRSRK